MGASGRVFVNPRGKAQSLLENGRWHRGGRAPRGKLEPSACGFTLARRDTARNLGGDRTVQVRIGGLIHLPHCGPRRSVQRCDNARWSGRSCWLGEVCYARALGESTRAKGAGHELGSTAARWPALTLVHTPVHAAGSTRTRSASRSFSERSSPRTTSRRCMSSTIASSRSKRGTSRRRGRLIGEL